MTKRNKPIVSKNLLLVIAFLVLITISYVIALFLGYNFTRNFVENDFNTKKIEVFDQSLAPYNDFFQNRIGEVSYYQGYLDSLSGKKYADSIIAHYPIVERILFADVQISNHYLNHGFSIHQLFMSPKAIYQFGEDVNPDSILLYKAAIDSNLSLNKADEFNTMAVKFASFIESADSSVTLSSSEIFNSFYLVSSTKISYMTIPSREEINTFKTFMNDGGSDNSIYELDIMTFFLNPNNLQIKNVHPELYQNISIEPLFFESFESDPTVIVTQMPLSGALSDFKLYFQSSQSFLDKEINNLFLPITLVISIIYLILLLIAYLIYRNLNINFRMFKLQYDFINNLSHEFKTPVSVIKIAGSNIRSSKQLSDIERDYYGKILDEEADKLNNLLNTLLSFTQIENKVFKLNKEHINLEEFCQNMVNTYKVKHPDFDIQYTVRGIEVIRTDMTLLTSVFHNMIDNAYKYSSLENKYLRIIIYKQKREIFFKFEDKGIGIAKEEQGNIFKKFYRIQSQYNQQGSVGLGLAFCQEVVHLMHGEISVESKKGKGSTFTIVLPLEFN